MVLRAATVLSATQFIALALEFSGFEHKVSNEHMLIIRPTYSGPPKLLEIPKRAVGGSCNARWDTPENTRGWVVRQRASLTKRFRMRRKLS
jgi:hypothetical protein